MLTLYDQGKINVLKKVLEQLSKIKNVDEKTKNKIKDNIRGILTKLENNEELTTNENKLYFSPVANWTHALEKLKMDKMDNSEVSENQLPNDDWFKTTQRTPTTECAKEDKITINETTNYIIKIIKDGTIIEKIEKEEEKEGGRRKQRKTTKARKNKKKKKATRTKRIKQKKKSTRKNKIGTKKR